MRFKLIYNSSNVDKKGYIERTIPCNHNGVVVKNVENIHRSLDNDTISQMAFGLVCNTKVMYQSTFYVGYKDLMVVFSGERLLGFMNPDLFLKAKVQENKRNKSLQLLNQFFPTDMTSLPNPSLIPISLNTGKIELPEHINLFPEYPLFMGLCVDMARGILTSDMQDYVDAIGIANSGFSNKEPSEKVREKARKLLGKYNIKY